MCGLPYCVGTCVCLHHHLGLGCVRSSPHGQAAGTLIWALLREGPLSLAPTCPSLDAPRNLKSMISLRRARVGYKSLHGRESAHTRTAGRLPGDNWVSRRTPLARLRPPRQRHFQSTSWWRRLGPCLPPPRGRQGGRAAAGRSGQREGQPL